MNILQAKFLNKFNKKLDIRSIVNGSTNVNLLLERLMTRSQRMLLKYQKKKVLTTIDSSLDESDFDGAL